MPDRILTEDVREDLRHSFSHMKEPVNIHLFTAKGSNDQYNALATQLLDEFSEVEGRLVIHKHTLKSPEAKKYSVQRSPSILIEPEKYNIRFTGTPLGEEGRTFVMAILMASTGSLIMIEPETAKRFAEVGDKRHVQVYVSPT